MLNTIVHGAAGDAPPLILAHGLYGSARNWGVIAKRLSDARQVIACDMRNHGDSPWEPSHGYDDMAGDVARVIRAHGGRADVLGHSMGGKAAMVLAVSRPALVRRLVVGDIAPVAYAHDQIRYIEAMRAVDLAQVTRRSEAAERLKPYLDDPALAAFLTQSLDVARRGWKLNLDVLEAEMGRIEGFPEIEGRFDGPALFLAGERSDYVKRDYRPAIKGLFPKARFASLKGAGHWLHAEAPRDFEASVRAFLDQPEEQT